MLNPLYEGVAWAIVHIHSGLAPIMSTGAAWALSIVFLTMAMRLVLFPLFVKQIKTQRQMQVLQPKIKELQAKHKNNKEQLNTELMALYREHGANPLTGCLPLIVQIPIFIALFHVLDSIKPTIKSGVVTYPSNVLGFPHDLVRSAAQAKIFGVPIAAAFGSNSSVLSALHANSTTVKVLTASMIVLMAVSTFFTQRQLMARTASQGNPIAGQQKTLLYVLPLVFAVFGFRFQLGVLLYWLTTNVWSMVQQYFVIRRMNPATAGPGGAPAPVVPRNPGYGPAGRRADGAASGAASGAVAVVESAGDDGAGAPPATGGGEARAAGDGIAGPGQAAPVGARRPGQPKKPRRNRRGGRR